MKPFIRPWRDVRGVEHDMARGPCVCGAWHEYRDWCRAEYMEASGQDPIVGGQEPPDYIDMMLEQLLNQLREGSMMIRKFASGATRDSDVSKYDYEGFLSPLVLERYAQYMQAHRVQADGGLRDSDNWQKGIPLDAYMKSGWRHFVDVWKEHRGHETADGLENSLCALLFNIQGYLHETIKAKSRYDDHGLPVDGCNDKAGDTDDIPF